MSISEKDVRYVARLARLALSEEETRLYAGQFQKILDYMEDLKKLDTAEVPPTSHNLGFTNVFREDEAKPCEPEALLEAAPDREADYFKVQKVIG